MSQARLGSAWSEHFSEGGLQVCCDCCYFSRPTLGSAKAAGLETLWGWGEGDVHALAQRRWVGWGAYLSLSLSLHPLPTKSCPIWKGCSESRLGRSARQVVLLRKHPRKPQEGQLNITCVRHIWISGKQRNEKKKKKRFVRRKPNR